MKDPADQDQIRVYPSEGACRVCLAGELDAYAIQTFPPAEIIGAGTEAREIVLDLRRVIYLDSTALRWLLRVQRAAQALDRSVTVYAQEGTIVARVLELVGAGCILAVRTFEESAPDTP